MNVSAPFVRRPMATVLLAVAVLISGMLAYTLLPVAPLPRVDFPTIQVSASLPGASPETMASAVATPLERRFGRIAGVTEITSTSALGTGDGAELRRPLGISIVGGLLVSQLLTLYTTPVIYLYLDRFRLWTKGERTRPSPQLAPHAGD